MKKKLILFIVFGILVLAYKMIKPATKVNLGKDYTFYDAGFDNWQSIFKDKEEVIPIKVVEYQSDDRYIIAVRVVIDLYECYELNTTELTPQNNIALPVVPRHQLQYWIIDKNKNIAYFSKYKKVVEKFLKKTSSKLSFSKNTYFDEVAMQLKTNDHNDEYQCVQTNKIVDKKRNVRILNLDDPLYEKSNQT